MRSYYDHMRQYSGKEREVDQLICLLLYGMSTVNLVKLFICHVYVTEEFNNSMNNDYQE